MSDVRRRWFFAAALVVTLLVAGLLAYLADSNPDGLESALAQGCTTVAGELAGELAGDCPAALAEDHVLAGSPLADYTVNGSDSMTGLAGVVGVVLTLLLTAGMFRLLRPRARR